MLGKQSIYAKEAHEGNYIGAGWLPEVDLTKKLTDNWREFNKEMIPLYLSKYPDKTKIAAGLACAMVHTVSRGILKGDIVLCPDGQRNYFVGEVTGDYFFQPGTSLPHRRSVNWYPGTISRDGMSEQLKNSTGAIGMVSISPNITMRLNS